MTAVIEIAHPPLTPSFTCAKCGQPWPCAPAQVDLAEKYVGNIASLAMYLSGHMCEAVDSAVCDHQWGHVNNLYDRFLGWVSNGKEVPSAA